MVRISVKLVKQGDHLLRLTKTLAACMSKLKPKPVKVKKALTSQTET